MNEPIIIFHHGNRDNVPPGILNEGQGKETTFIFKPNIDPDMPWTCHYKRYCEHLKTWFSEIMIVKKDGSEHLVSSIDCKYIRY